MMLNDVGLPASTVHVVIYMSLIHTCECLSVIISLEELKKNLKGNNENNPEWIKKAHNQSFVNQDVVKSVSGSSLTIKSQNDGEME